jgi:hypothetical protein
VRSSFFPTQRMAATTGVYVAAGVPVILGAVAGPPRGGFSIATVFGFGALVYLLSLALGVESQEVVPAETHAVNGWLTGQAHVRPVPVVAV